jgi:hypothetical protein
MLDDEGLAHEKTVALDAWADRHTALLDQELTDAWPALAACLEEGVATLSWRELAFGPGKDFQRRCVGPAVERWVGLHVLPAGERACAELEALLPKGHGPLAGSAPAAGGGEGNLGALDVLKGLTLLGAPLAAGGALWAAITTTTNLLVFTTVAVNWPLLIAGLAVALALAFFGGAHLARLRGELQKRFRGKLLPRVKAALVGEGVEHGGERVPSLLAQLQGKVREAAGAARAALPT